MSIRQTIGMIGFVAGLGVAVSCAQAQSAPSTKTDPTHKLDVGPGVVLFKFGTGENCKKGEYLLAHTSVITKQVLWGCGHAWHGIDFFRFADGEIGAIDTVKWEVIGPKS